MSVEFYGFFLLHSVSKGGVYPRVLGVSVLPSLGQSATGFLEHCKKLLHIITMIVKYVCVCDYLIHSGLTRLPNEL